MNTAGKICPYCKMTLTEGDDTVMCNQCEIPHHKECWVENKGCTTFGCSGSIQGIAEVAQGEKTRFFCSHCSVEALESDVFCTHCGAMHATAGGDESSAMMAEQAALPEVTVLDKGKNPSKALRIWIPILIVVAVAFAGLSAYGFLQADQLKDIIAYKDAELQGRNAEIKTLSNENASLDTEIQTSKTKLTTLEKENKKLQDDIRTSQTRIKTLESEVKTDQEIIFQLVSENSSLRYLEYFIDNHVVFIEDDRSYLYHKFNCYRFKKNYFWIYNIENARAQGFTKCYACHDY